MGDRAMAEEASKTTSSETPEYLSAAPYGFGSGPFGAHPGIHPGMGYPGMGRPGYGAPGMGYPGLGYVHTGRVHNPAEYSYADAQAYAAITEAERVKAIEDSQKLEESKIEVNQMDEAKRRAGWEAENQAHEEHIKAEFQKNQDNFDGEVRQRQQLGRMKAKEHAAHIAAMKRRHEAEIAALMETQAQSLRMAEAQFEQEKRKRAEEMQAAKEKYDASVRVRRNAHMEAAALHRESESERRSGFFEEQTRREEALCADKKAHQDDLNEKKQAWSEAASAHAELMVRSHGLPHGLHAAYGRPF